MLGIISGTVLLTQMHDFKKAKMIRKLNEFGEASLFLSEELAFLPRHGHDAHGYILPHRINHQAKDRKSTRLNSSHQKISYAVFCLKKKKTEQEEDNGDEKKEAEKEEWARESSR